MTADYAISAAASQRCGAGLVEREKARVSAIGQNPRETCNTSPRKKSRWMGHPRF
jgi:hypothetical protein